MIADWRWTSLGGRPGVYSARYAGPNATDQDRYLRLLSDLQACTHHRGLPDSVALWRLPPPPARFIWQMAPLEGVITDQPAGSHGFGYDPVFFLPERGVTLAECPPEIKNTISHRAIAAIHARSILGQLLANEDNGRQSAS
jgi:XTP/dITP diphosphohydrolase